jgi:hypothetical protein
MVGNSTATATQLMTVDVSDIGFRGKMEKKKRGSGFCAFETKGLKEKRSTQTNQIGGRQRGDNRQHHQGQQGGKRLQKAKPRSRESTHDQAEAGLACQGGGNGT